MEAARSIGSNWFLAGLLAIVVIGTAVRAPLLGYASNSYRLTEAINLEEAENVRISSGMLHKSTLNPHAFEYPSLYYYACLAIEKVLSTFGRADWSAFLLGARSLSLLFGVGAIALSGWLGLRLGNPASGLLAATLVALDRTSIQMATLAKPNSAQTFFVLAGLAALVALVARPRVRTAMLASACFALGMASKWLGLLGLPALAFAGAMATPQSGVGGMRGIFDRLRAALRHPVSPLALLLPIVVFGAVFLLCVPFALLSVREFGMGFAQVFLAQGSHRRDLPWWISLQYLAESLGPVAAILVAVAVVWALFRIARWRDTPRENGLLVLAAWTAGYGVLVLFAFARLPSYVDLWVAPLAVLAGCAWLGPDGFLRRGGPAAALIALVLVSGSLTNARPEMGRAGELPRDSRLLAGAWLDRHAEAEDRVIADQGAYIPDRIGSVHWNAWGGPDRVVYDETRTWGSDERWPDWYGGHRQLLFRNARWAAPESALVEIAPRWVVTTSEWAHNRISPPSHNDWISTRYDGALADGSAGFVERARFAGSPGPVILVYERVQATP